MPASAGGSTRTLGFTKSAMRHSSRKCGLRRELEQPRGGISAGQRHDAWARSPRPRPHGSAPENAESLHRSAERSTSAGRERFAGGVSCQSVTCQESVCRPPPPAAHGLRSASAVAAKKSPSRRLPPRRASGTLICRNLCALRNFAAFNPVKPNPSFKPSPNGVPRGPGWRYPVHFRHPGPRVTPPVPA